MHHIAADGRTVLAHRQEHFAQASVAVPAMLDPCLASFRPLTPVPVFHPFAKPANVVAPAPENAMTDEDPREAELERRLQKEWGPDLPLWKRRLFAAVVIVAFFGLVLAALVTSSR
jgi:hypothetical protein